jgi:hypothetical protein
MPPSRQHRVFARAGFRPSRGARHKRAESKRGPASLPAPVSPDFGCSPLRVRDLVSAACSARAGKGMRASRRSSRPAVSTHPGTCVPEELPFRPRRPACLGTGAPMQALLNANSSPSDLRSSLRLRFLPTRFRPLARPSASQEPSVSLARPSSRSSKPLSRLFVRRFGTACAPPPLTRHTGASPSRSLRVSRRILHAFGPCKSLALLWFPSAWLPSYSYKTVIESESWEGRKTQVGLWIM